MNHLRTSVPSFGFTEQRIVLKWFALEIKNSFHKDHEAKSFIYNTH